MSSNILVRSRLDPRRFDEAGASLRLEKILARKRVASRASDLPSFQYLVKYKGMSYLHVEWLSPAAIMKKDPRNKVLLKKFVKSWLAKGCSDDELGEVFDPAFVDVERIIGVKEVEHDRSVAASVEAAGRQLAGDGTPVTPRAVEAMYLVKWTGLSYLECTWEWASDLQVEDAVKIERFRASCVVPPGAEAAAMPRTVAGAVLAPAPAPSRVKHTKLPVLFIEALTAAAAHLSLPRK